MLLSTKTNVYMKLFKKIFKITFLFSFITAFILTIFYIYYKQKIPNIDEIIKNSSAQKINILYNDGITPIKIKNNTTIGAIQFEDLPKNLVNALIATEDRKFFQHKGIDIFSILRATITNILYGRIKQGGSTITQQLAKIILQDNSKTLKRKFKELILTLELEKYMSKEDIITLYFTKAYFGCGQYGIVAAADYYFAKNIGKLELEECAMLVGLLKAPTKYNPKKSIANTKDRTLQVIINMQKAGFISENDIFSYVIPDLKISDNVSKGKQTQNYYFTDWIESQTKEYNLPQNSDAITIVTTLDSFIQDSVNSTLQNFISKNKDIIGKSEIAIIVLNKNGEILSMVGGKNYNRSQFNRAVYAKRQTGSLFKLFVYLAGFENGLKINDTFLDERIKIGKWYPENYRNNYRGEISVKEAFIYSSNSVAVQIADYFGLKKVINVAKKLGITGNFKNDMTISLGSQENTLLEMSGAYATIINDGTPVFPHGIRKIISDGEVIYNRVIASKDPVLTEKTLENIKYLLFSTIAEGTGRRAYISDLVNKTKLYNMLHGNNEFFIGGKTGSTQNNRDAWFVGFADNLIVGVWIGNDDNSPMNGVMGGNLPAELWKEVLEGIR